MPNSCQIGMARGVATSHSMALKAQFKRDRGNRAGGRVRIRGAATDTCVLSIPTLIGPLEFRREQGGGRVHQVGWRQALALCR